MEVRLRKERYYKLVVFISTNALSSSILLAETVVVLSSAIAQRPAANNKEDIVYKNIEEKWTKN